MTTETDMIETLRDTTPFCDDVIKLILDYATPRKFQVNKIYQGYSRDGAKRIKELFFVSKINKKSIRNEGDYINQYMSRIPLEDLISFDVYTNLKNIIFKFKKNNLIWDRYESTKDFLVYKDDTYLYYGYRFDHGFTTYKLKQDKTGQEYICNRLTKYQDKIYPMHEADMTKYTFLNIPPHLYKYF